MCFSKATLEHSLHFALEGVQQLVGEKDGERKRGQNFTVKAQPA